MVFGSDHAYDRIGQVVESELMSLLTAECFADAISSGVEAWRRVVDGVDPGERLVRRPAP